MLSTILFYDKYFRTLCFNTAFHFTPSLKQYGMKLCHQLTQAMNYKILEKFMNNAASA